MKHLSRFAGLTVIAAVALFQGCGGGDEGGITQEQLDRATLQAINALVTDEFNQHVAGTKGKNKDILVSLPGGGTMRIAGTTIPSLSLTYTFNNANIVGNSGAWSASFQGLNGDLVQTGTANAPALSSDNLAGSVSLDAGAAGPVTVAGPLVLDADWDGRAWTGQINNRVLYWERPSPYTVGEPSLLSTIEVPAGEPGAGLPQGGAGISNGLYSREGTWRGKQTTTMTATTRGISVTQPPQTGDMVLYFDANGNTDLPLSTITWNGNSFTLTTTAQFTTMTYRGTIYENTITGTIHGTSGTAEAMVTTDGTFNLTRQ